MSWNIKAHFLSVRWNGIFSQSHRNIIVLYLSVSVPVRKRFIPSNGDFKVQHVLSFLLIISILLSLHTSCEAIHPFFTAFSLNNMTS